MYLFTEVLTSIITIILILNIRGSKSYEYCSVRAMESEEINCFPNTLKA